MNLFRIWNSSKKQLYYINKEGYAVLDGEILDFKFLLGYPDKVFLWSPEDATVRDVTDRCEVMFAQKDVYSALGKEVYSGDYISKKGSATGLVLPDGTLSHSRLALSHWTGVCSVLGNKFENPELEEVAILDPPNFDHIASH